MDDPKLTTQERYEITEREFHKSNKLWGEIESNYADASLKLFDDTIKFVYQALTAMGIIAGFGFAGITAVQNIFLFSLGELTMFCAMMFGLYRIKIIYVKNSEAVDETSQKIRSAYEPIASALYLIMQQLISTGEVKIQCQLMTIKKQTWTLKKY